MVSTPTIYADVYARYIGTNKTLLSYFASNNLNPDFLGFLNCNRVDMGSGFAIGNEFLTKKLVFNTLQRNTPTQLETMYEPTVYIWFGKVSTNAEPFKNLFALPEADEGYQIVFRGLKHFKEQDLSNPANYDVWMFF